MLGFGFSINMIRDRNVFACEGRGGNKGKEEGGKGKRRGGKMMEGKKQELALSSKQKL